MKYWSERHPLFVQMYGGGDGGRGQGFVPGEGTFGIVIITITIIGVSASHREGRGSEVVGTGEGMILDHIGQEGIMYHKVAQVQCVVLAGSPGCRCT